MLQIKIDMELTELQEVFLNDLKKERTMVISLKGLQYKYADITYKEAVKREIEELVSQGVVSRKIRKTTFKGRFISKVIYTLIENNKHQ